MAGDLATAHAGEPRLRAALAAAASAPVDPAWAMIRSRVLDEGPHAAPPLTGTATTSPARRVAVLAAAAALLVIVAGVVVASRPDDAPAQRAGTTAGPSGWFVPVDLPDGWSVTSVLASRPDAERCPGPEEEPVRGVRWVRPDDGASVVLTTDYCGMADTDRGPGADDLTRPERAEDEELDLGPLPGWLSRSLVGEEHRLAWQIGRVPWMLESSGVSAEDLVALAREVAGAGTATKGTVDVVPSGFTVADRWTEPPQQHTSVEVEVTTADGLVLTYVMAPPGAGYFRAQPDARPYRVAREGMAVQSLAFESEPWMAHYGVAGPEVDLTLWSYAPDPTRDRAGIANAATLLVEALVPASVEQWRDLLADAEDHTPVLDEAVTVAELGRADVPPRPRPPTPPDTGPRETIIASTMPSTSSTTAPP
ncbi:MAG TPA: hypothetical protein VK507_23760 [Iamia sp.]|nr:hypothetical protein [Iamia sp.]